MDDLKPCPFCGGEADMVQPGTYKYSCIVECQNCGCRLESSDEGEHSGRAWNTRTPYPASPSGAGDKEKT